MTTQTKTNNLNYLTNPTFNKFNRLFLLLLQNEDDRFSCSEYYGPKVQTKDFKLLIGEKCFFDLSVKNKKETSEKIVEMSNNSDYTNGNLLDYEYFSKPYKLTDIDLNK